METSGLVAATNPTAPLTDAYHGGTSTRMVKRTFMEIATNVRIAYPI